MPRMFKDRPGDDPTRCSSPGNREASIPPSGCSPPSHPCSTRHQATGTDRPAPRQSERSTRRDRHRHRQRSARRRALRGNRSALALPRAGDTGRCRRTVARGYQSGMALQLLLIGGECGLGLLQRAEHGPVELASAARLSAWLPAIRARTASWFSDQLISGPTSQRNARRRTGRSATRCSRRPIRRG